MKRIAGLLFVSLFLAAPSCSDSDDESDTTPAPNPPVSACADPAAPTTAPSLSETAAKPTQIAVNPTSASPAQVVAVTVDGGLPNPCYKLARFEEKREGCSIFVNPVMISTGEICIQVLGTFKETYSLTAPDQPGKYWIVAGSSLTVAAQLEVKP